MQTGLVQAFLVLQKCSRQRDLYQSDFSANFDTVSPSARLLLRPNILELDQTKNHCLRKMALPNGFERQGLSDHKVRTQILEMHPDLMHSTGTWLAKDHAGTAVVAEALEIRVTVLARTRNFAYPDLVRNHFDGLFASNRLPEMKKKIMKYEKIYIPRKKYIFQGKKLGKKVLLSTLDSHF